MTATATSCRRVDRPATAREGRDARVSRVRALLVRAPSGERRPAASACERRPERRRADARSGPCLPWLLAGGWGEGGCGGWGSDGRRARQEEHDDPTNSTSSRPLRRPHCLQPSLWPSCMCLRAACPDQDSSPSTASWLAPSPTPSKADGPSHRPAHARNPLRRRRRRRRQASFLPSGQRPRILPRRSPAPSRPRPAPSSRTI